MKKTRPILTMGHVKESMDRDITLGSDTSRDGYRILFTFNPHVGEFRVHHDNDGVIAFGGRREVQDLLKTYNEL